MTKQNEYIKTAKKIIKLKGDCVTNNYFCEKCPLSIEGCYSYDKNKDTLRKIKNYLTKGTASE